MAGNERIVLVTQSNKPSGDDHSWRIRSELWNRRSAKIANQRAKHERPQTPLILSGHGVSLRIDGGSLLIRNGLTHYPQKAETYRFFKGELAIPERIIMLDGTGSISFDVLAWLAEQRVSLIQINWKGEVSSFTSAMPQILIAYSGSEKRALIVRSEWHFASR
jgi:CRISP-associated protein Cas1